MKYVCAVLVLSASIGSALAQGPHTPQHGVVLEEKLVTDVDGQVCRVRMEDVVEFVGNRGVDYVARLVTGSDEWTRDCPRGTTYIVSAKEAIDMMAVFSIIFKQEC